MQTGVQDGAVVHGHGEGFGLVAERFVLGGRGWEFRGDDSVGASLGIDIGDTLEKLVTY